MPTELDTAMNRQVSGLTAAGGPLALGTADRDGRSYPLIATAPATLPQYFARYCAQHGQAEFLVAGAERLSFAAVHAASIRVARGLVARGVRKGDRVGIAMRNSPSWIVLYMGILTAGGVATLLNGWWQTGELCDAITDVGCRLVFVDAVRAARLAGHTDAELVLIDDDRPLDRALAPVAVGGDAVLPTVAAEDWATILFTSGSTGRCKGALSDHRAVVQGAFHFLCSALTMRGLAAEAGTLPAGQPATLLNLPLFHITAEVPVMLQSFALGRKLVLMRKWDAADAMRLIAQERVTYFVGVPLMSFELLTHPDRARFDLSSVTDFSAGGAPRPVEHVRRIAAEMGGAPVIGFGLTETNGAGTSNWRSNYLAKPASAGRPSSPLVELAIVGPDGRTLGAGEPGEVAIRSICTFLRYWNDEAATRAAFTADGYLLTGDIGYLDEDGYLFIVGRSKDVVIRGGENIGCQEVEAALYAHPAVAEAAVFALPDQRFGEVPAAVVRLADGATADEDALRAFLRGRIAAFKVPARIWPRATPLPRLGTEKVDKLALRTRYSLIAARDRAAAGAPSTTSPVSATVPE